MGKGAIPTNFYNKSPNKEKFAKQPGSAWVNTIDTALNVQQAS